MPETGHKGLLMPGFRFNTNTMSLLELRLVVNTAGSEKL
eukprot:COSAG02_NODE_97_length_37159_cov_37.660335_31_plen_39_part_00